MDRKPESRKFNTKYRVLRACEYTALRDDLERKSNQVIYTGNPKHKKNPGNFGLTPPSDPRPNTSLCDNARIFRKEEAEELLKKAFRLGLIDRRTPPGEWPKAVRIVHDGIVLQAMYENQPGYYHGFPLSGNEPLWKEMMQAWKDRQ